ncbi:MAG TPA: transglycosylase SLT domain-containing protein, partial [Geothrix sp.]
ISGGVKYLKWLHSYYEGDLTRVVAAYNAGEGAVNRHKGIPPFAETRAYVPKVLDLYRRKAVQPDPKQAGSMAMLQKGRGGFKLEELKGVPIPTPQQRAASRVYQWTDADGRLQISDQPPPKASASVKSFGGAS